MRISVVIPHLNQENDLRRCLASLHSGQEAENVDVEILVVDNGSKRLPEDVCEEWETVRLLTEDTPGPGPARNRGSVEATGDILAFIDADCRAEPGWIAAIAGALSLPNRPIIGGDVRVGFEDPDNPTALEAYENIYAYRNKMYIEREGYSGTGNLATFPAVLKDVGPFAGIHVAEDWDWGQRAGKAGYRITYVPEMIIYHPARKTFAELTLKWDRHIAHHYEEGGKRRFHLLRWLTRTAAIAVSPLAEIWTVATSPRISGLKARWLAFKCLLRIRLYRAFRMFQVMLQGNSRKISGAWNR